MPYAYVSTPVSLVQVAMVLASVAHIYSTASSTWIGGGARHGGGSGDEGGEGGGGAGGVRGGTGQG